jgi:hypothetical protein
MAVIWITAYGPPVRKFTASARLSQLPISRDIASIPRTEEMMKTLSLALLIAFSTLTAAHAEWEILDPGMPAATKSAPVTTATQPVNPSTTPVVAQRQK